MNDAFAPSCDVIKMIISMKPGNQMNLQPHVSFALANTSSHPSIKKQHFTSHANHSCLLKVGQVYTLTEENHRSSFEKSHRLLL